MTKFLYIYELFNNVSRGALKGALDAQWGGGFIGHCMMVVHCVGGEVGFGAVFVGFGGLEGVFL